MDRAKIVAFVLLVALCLSLPLLWLLLRRPDRSLPQDYSTFSYFAVTGNGQEYIYAPGEDGFLMAADAFSHAVAGDAPAWYREDAPKMLLEWIEGDRAHQYMLYLSASPMAAYLTDDRGGGYLLRRVDAIRFFAGEGAPAPEGEEPPTFTIGEREIRASLCRWTYTETAEDGREYTATSGDVYRTGGVYPLDTADFAPVFALTPSEVRYTVFSGNVPVATGQTPPDFSALPTGEYELAVVAEWERGDDTVKAGYSFVFSVS